MLPTQTVGSITKDMRVLDIVTLCPSAEHIMAEYGLHCFHCEANAFESLVDGCRGHGFEEEEIDALVHDINDLIAAQPVRPQTLTITLEAAKGLRAIAESEGKLDQILSVVADGKGSFCLEFQASIGEDDLECTNSDVPDMRIAASTLSLVRIGGATIDMRDGRFKLEMDTDKTGCACGGSCGCK